MTNLPPFNPDWPVPDHPWWRWALIFGLTFIAVLLITTCWPLVLAIWSVGLWLMR